MSNPLTRRIARTALLTAAGAATVVGAAGAASAVELPASPVGGVSNLDGEGLGNTLDRTAQDTTAVAGETGGSAVKKAVPTAGKAVGT
ncbi:ATP-binding protein, partial [Streptomyces nanshensis]